MSAVNSIAKNTAKNTAVLLALVFAASHAQGADEGRDQVEGYRVAVQRALFLDDATRAKRPEIPGNFQDIMRAQLCTKEALAGALAKSSTTYQDACEVLDGNAPNIAECTPGSCVALRVSPEIYGNADLRRKTEDALRNPCAYYLSPDVLIALGERAATDSDRKELQAEYGKDISFDVNNQKNASAAFQCSSGGVTSRKVAVSHGDEVSVVTVAP